MVTTKLIFINGDSGRAEIRICTMDMALGQKDIGTQETMGYIML